jgi:RNA polymerase sigma factor (sigma-70 family)
MLRNMTANDGDLLQKFLRDQSQDAFTTLVNRHVNLVYSAALRQVRSPQLAEDVCQAVFTKLAHQAAHLEPKTILTAWLYQVTRHTAIDLLRTEIRRQAREQIAIQMTEMNQNPDDWKEVEPLLDEAMDALEEPDRTALLLRYFENKSLREVGQALGATEDAAQKRVARAVERLRDIFSARKVTIGAGAIVALLSANAVQAAPVGLGTTLAAGALVTGTIASTSIPIAVTKTIAMTALQKTIIATVLTGAVAIGLFQAHRVSELHQQVQALQKQQEQQIGLSNQLHSMQVERDQAVARLATLSAQAEPEKKSPNDLLKLRGEVGRLRKENADIGASSGLSKVTANPESRKMLRDQQKVGMSMIYKGFANRSKLSTEQADKLNDLLADNIMENVDHVTTVLRDKPDSEKMNELFAAQEAALEEKVKSQLGPDGLAEYQDYTKNLLSSLSSEQFKSMMTGTDAEKAEKSKQLFEIMKAEVQSALTAAGLPSDYQTVPMLNFRNIASEQEGERSLKLLDDIYKQVAARSSAFFSPEDVTKFQEFKTMAINNNRSALTLNRTMMAPINQ